MVSERQKAIFSLVLLAFSFASIGIFIRFLSTGFPLYQQIYLRLFIAFLLGLVFFRRVRLSIFLSLKGKEWGLLLLRAFSMYVIAFILYNRAILLTKYASVGFIGSLPSTAILGVLIFKERLGLKKFLLILAALLGAFLISVKDFSNIFGWGLGETLVLISLFFFSFSYLARRWQSSTLNEQEMTLIQLFLGALMVFLISPLDRGSVLESPWQVSFLLAFILSGLINVANLYLINYSFSRVKAVLAGNILTLEAVFALVWSVLLYREIPGAREFLGGGLILMSVFVMNWLDRDGT